ncbi:MAG: hypothetical protein PHT54_04920 [Candidatus Nanoarchaeia archaeon]|nr:hypothetical protein [Candidatus Nanoarchaeia archaeon]
MRLYSKKGDIGMIETIMVVIVILIILILAAVFYFKFQKSGIEEKTGELTDQRANVLLTYATRMPELQCSFRNKEESSCIDSLKIISFNKLKNKEDYYDVFGFRTLKVKIIASPFGTKAGDCLKAYTLDYGNYPGNCDEFTIYSNPKPNFESKSVVGIPVVVYFPVKEKYLIGKLVVESYE